MKMMKTKNSLFLLSALGPALLWAAWRWNRRPQPEPPGGGVEKWWSIPRGAGAMEHEEWMTNYTVGDS